MFKVRSGNWSLLYITGFFWGCHRTILLRFNLEPPGKNVTLSSRPREAMLHQNWKSIANTTRLVPPFLDQSSPQLKMSSIFRKNDDTWVPAHSWRTPLRGAADDSQLWAHRWQSTASNGIDMVYKRTPTWKNVCGRWFKPGVLMKAIFEGAGQKLDHNSLVSRESG